LWEGALQMQKELLEYIDISDAIKMIEKNREEDGRRFLVTGVVRVWPSNYTYLGYYGCSPKKENIHFSMK